jgi:SAM-dependent methyltransferase
MGPLYHLTEREDRVAALKEAYRVLLPGGLLFAAAIGHFASLMSSLAVGFFDHPQFSPMLDRCLSDGQHRNTTGDPLFFTTAFFHRPEELHGEITEAGFVMRELLPVEGPGWMAMKPDETWLEAAKWERLLALVRRVEHETSLIGLSHHLLAVATKPRTESSAGR